uniref:PCI domain-containing protein n=1 Tax=Chrysotila carterae TaxID=13221 RepID=A0A7S4BL18_CHRCT
MATSSGSTLDVEAYISHYSGYTRLKRLQFIAQQDAGLRSEALRLAFEEVKKTANVAMYNELVAMDPNAPGVDEAWAKETKKSSTQTLEKLETELTSHKTSLIKEAIRMGHNDLAEFHCDRGDFTTALKCFVRTRDYCTTTKHTVSMCLNVIKISIHMGNFTHVSNYVTKAESTPSGSDALLTSQLKIAAGLTHLSGKKYKLAARKFLEVNADLGSGFNEVASSQDVALYGSLCALAAFDRQELKAKLIDNSAFRTLLELFPEVRELVSDFYGSKYASCLSYLDKLKPDLLLDIHLHWHLSQLYEDIRSKAMIQYFSPFVTIDMTRMAAAFNTEVMQLEKELAKLIMAGLIPARIDSQNKVLHARHADKRHATFTKAVAMGEEYMRETQALLLRLNLLRADFTVKGAGETHGPSKSVRQERRVDAGDRPAASAFPLPLAEME